MEEIARLVPHYGGISYQRIEERGIQWSCPTKDHPGTATLNTERFVLAGGRALFMVIEHLDPRETCDADYPLNLTNELTRNTAAASPALQNTRRARADRTKRLRLNRGVRFPSFWREGGVPPPPGSSASMAVRSTEIDAELCSLLVGSRKWFCQLQPVFSECCIADGLRLLNRNIQFDEYYLSCYFVDSSW